MISSQLRITCFAVKDNLVLNTVETQGMYNGQYGWELSG